MSPPWLKRLPSEAIHMNSLPTGISVQKCPVVMSVIFLPSVISSDSTTFLVFFFGDLGERLVVDLMM